MAAALSCRIWFKRSRSAGVRRRQASRIASLSSTLRSSTDCTTSSSDSGVSVSVNSTMASMLRSAANGRR